jgi:hypothetical protein
VNVLSLSTPRGSQTSPGQVSEEFIVIAVAI